MHQTAPRSPAEGDPARVGRARWQKAGLGPPRRHLSPGEQGWPACGPRPGRGRALRCVGTAVSPGAGSGWDRHRPSRGHRVRRQTAPRWGRPGKAASRRGCSPDSGTKTGPAAWALPRRRLGTVPWARLCPPCPAAVLCGTSFPSRWRLRRPGSAHGRLPSRPGQQKPRLGAPARVPGKSLSPRPSQEAGGWEGEARTRWVHWGVRCARGRRRADPRLWFRKPCHLPRKP